MNSTTRNRNQNYKFYQFLMLLAALFMVAGRQTGSSSPSTALASSDAPEPPPTAVNSVGTVSARPKGFVLLFTGNWEAHLEPCGCTEKQLGGIDRRTETMNRIAPRRQESLLVDTGPIIKKQDRQSQLKYETFLYSLKQLGYDTINLTPKELILLSENLGMPPTEHSPTICSNLPAPQRKNFTVQSYLKKTLQYENHQLDCYVFSFWSPEQYAEKSLAEKLNPVKPLSTFKKLLSSQNIQPEHSSADKLIIVILSADDESLIQKLQQVPAVDILVVKGTADEPELCHPKNQETCRPMVFTTGKMGKYIVCVNIPFDSLHNINQYKFQPVTIESDFPRDPAIVSLLEEYQLRLRLENLVEDENALPRLPLTEGLSFVGNSVCAGCHTDIYSTWQKLSHAHAFETLQKIDRTYDPECVTCHTVGMKYESGYRSLESTGDLINVGCEMCHGPGSNHLLDATTDYQEIFTTCEQCHDHENSPEFEENREKYFKAIRHWSEPRRYWK